MSIPVYSILRSFAWGVVFLCGLAGTLGWIAAWGGVAGSFLCILSYGQHLVWRRFSINTERALPVVILILFLLLPLVAVLFGLPLCALILSNALIGALAASLTLLLIQSISSVSGLALVEPIAAALTATLPLLSSSHGHFTNPRWLSDLLIQSGMDPSTIHSWIGIAVIAVAILLLMPGKLSNTEGYGAVFGRVMGILLLVTLTVGGVILLSRIIPTVIFSSAEPPPPPLSFAGDPPPPPPPQPQPLAAVQFSKVIDPSRQRLKGFYFRQPDPECATNSVMDWGEGGRFSVQSTIFYLKNGVGPLVLPGNSFLTSIPSPSLRVPQASWSTSRLPRVGEHTDFRPSDVESIIAVELKTNSSTTATKEMEGVMDSIQSILDRKSPAPEKGILSRLVSSVENLPKVTSSTSLQACVIVDWLEQRGEYDSTATDNLPDCDSFIRGGLKGTSRHFAELAVKLMQSRGIKARLSEGYFVPAEKNPDDRVLIIDSHKETWPEVQTISGIWIPLPVKPLKVTTRDEPPPQEDRKEEIFDAIKKDKDKGKTESLIAVVVKPSYGWARPLLLGIAVTVALCFAIYWLSVELILPVVRIKKAVPAKRSRVLLRELSIQGERRFGSRRFGESWESFSGRIGDRNQRASQAMRKACDYADLDHPSDPGITVASKIMLSFVLSRLMPTILKKKTNHPQPNQPNVTA